MLYLSLRSLRICLLVTASFSSVLAHAQPVIYEATGPTKESIQPIVDKFKHDIVYGVGGDAQHPPLALGSFKTAVFDDVAAGSTKSQQLIGLESGGINFINGIGTFLPVLSAGDSDPNNPNRLFGDFNPIYPQWLQPYSGSSVLAGISLIAATQPSSLLFFGPPLGSSDQINAFGAVFSDVDFPNTVSFMPGGAYEVPAAPGNGNFSFLGVILPEVIPGGYVTVNLPGIPQDSSLTVEDLGHDLVAMDDVILGTAVPLPEPASIILIAIGAGTLWLVASARRGGVPADNCHQR